MAKKKFDIGYSMVVYCTTTIEAETKEEAEEIFENGNFSASLDRDVYDTDCFELAYIKEAEEEA